MSASEEIIARLDKLQKTTDWCAAALLQLLQQQAGELPEDPDAWLNEWEPELPTVGYPAQEETAGPTPCERRGHIHQRLDMATKHVVCADCGVDLIDTQANHFANAAKG